MNGSPAIGIFSRRCQNRQYHPRSRTAACHPADHQPPADGARAGNGTRLLIRGRRQITLTDAGILFQQRAEEIVSLLQKTARDIADQDDLLGGTVAVGCVESCASMLRPPSSAPMCRTSWHWYDAGMPECMNNQVKNCRRK